MLAAVNALAIWPTAASFLGFGEICEGGNVGDVFLLDVLEMAAATWARLCLLRLGTTATSRCLLLLALLFLALTTLGFDVTDLLS
jgi:hypothetical protein